MTLGGLTLDTGALISFERGGAKVRSVVLETLALGLPIHVPAGVVAQAWRGGPRQTNMARLLASAAVEIIALDQHVARSIGVMCALSGHADVIDVHVALHALEHGHTVVTSDPDDIAAVSPTVPVVVI